MIGLGYAFIYSMNSLYGTSFVGNFTIINSLFIILSTVCTLGFDTLSVKLVSSNDDNYNYLNTLYIKIITYIIPITLVLSSLIYYFAENIALIFQNIDLYLPIRILSFSLLPLALININGESFRGMKNMLFYSLYNKVFIVSVVFIIFLLMYFLNTGIHDSINIFYYYLYAILFLAVVSTLHLKFLYMKLNNKHSDNDKVLEIQKNKLISLSKNMLIISITFILFQFVDILMLGLLSTSEKVGIFTIIFKISSVVSIILIGVNSISGPIISNLFSKNKLDELKKYIRNMVRISSILTLPIILCIIYYSENILYLFGSEFIGYKYGLIRMCISQFINVISGSVGLIMQMTGNEKIFKNIILISIISNVLLNWILIPKFQVSGAVYATSISLVLWNIIGIIFIRKKNKIYSFIH